MALVALVADASPLGWYSFQISASVVSATELPRHRYRLCHRRAFFSSCPPSCPCQRVMKASMPGSVVMVMSRVLMGANRPDQRGFVKGMQGARRINGTARASECPNWEC
jgi:hypothetical protein